MLRQAVQKVLLQQRQMSYSRVRVTVNKLIIHSGYVTASSEFVYSFDKFIVVWNAGAPSFRRLHTSSVCTRTHRQFKQRNKQASDKEKALNEKNIDEELTATGISRNIGVKIVQQRNKYSHFSDFTPLYAEGKVSSVSDIDTASDDNRDVNEKFIPSGNRSISKSGQQMRTGLTQTDTYYKPRSVTEELLEEESYSNNGAVVAYSESRETKDLAELDVKHGLALADKGELDLHDIKKVEFPPLTNFAPIVNDTEVLKELVKLGVDLSEIQTKGMAEHILTMNFKKDVAPYILFLKDCGVPSDMIGKAVTRCPWIFQHNIHNLRVRVDYLRSKKFKQEAIANMIDRDPRFLLIPVERIDSKLGFLQKEFHLAGSQVREKVGGLSKLIFQPKFLIKRRKFYLHRILGFTEQEIKTIFLTCPKVFLQRSEGIAEKFDYLHNVMEIPHELIAKTPQTLNTTQHKLESRHRFLVKCGRAQYNPQKENYVSLKALVTGDDETWCFEVAKSSVADYNEFLKCI